MPSPLALPCQPVRRIACDSSMQPPGELALRWLVRSLLVRSTARRMLARGPPALLPCHP
jgi:hypothetical protein